MPSFIKNASLLGVKKGRCGSVVEISRIRKANLPYILLWIIYYTWVIVFTTWWTASPVTENILSSGLRMMLHSINLLSSAFFVFVMNNTEKFYCVLGSNLLINIIMLLELECFGDKISEDGVYLISYLILTASLTATIFFKKSSIENSSKELADAPAITPRIYLTLLNNGAIAILCRGVGKGILNITADTNTGVHLMYFVGGLIGCIVFFVLNAVYRRAFIWLNNITFSTIAMGLLCNAFAEDIPQMVTVFAILLGIGGTVGMINIYYILAVVGKKFNSLRYVRLSIFFIGIGGGISGLLIASMMSRIDAAWVSIITSIVATAFLLIFLILSPNLVWAQENNDWINDAGKSEIDNKQKDIFAEYTLSRREVEVCKLLLEGNTLRQISAILNIAYSTVNTYCTSIYRKLEINSRAELIILFKEYIKDKEEIV